MSKIVGIKFKPTGKVYHFDPGLFVLNGGDYVIVESEQGLGFGFVAVPPVSLDENMPPRPLKKVFRLANEKDFEQKQRNIETEKQAYDFCVECVKELKLDMSLFSVESSFDGTKLTFFFTADGRIDFRQLVKMMVKEYHTRIEMRQVGIRNRAKMCGGIGRCGRILCCATFLDKFDPVSIRMAKEQGLSLNPTKISGQCGRLMCCLTFENDTYAALKEKFPRIGALVETSKGKVRVMRHNVIADRVAVQMEGVEGQEFEIPIENIKKIYEYEEDIPTESIEGVEAPEEMIS